MLNPKSLSTHLLLTCWAQLVGYAIKGIMPQNGNGVKMGLSPQLGQDIDVVTWLSRHLGHDIGVITRYNKAAVQLWLSKCDIVMSVALRRFLQRGSLQSYSSNWMFSAHVCAIQWPLEAKICSATMILLSDNKRVV